jgi:GNAT superfamily N-acetyltransferase
MSRLAVRASRPDDAPEIIRLVSILFRAMGIEPVGLKWRAETGRLVRERAGSDECAVYVAEADGHLVSCGGVTLASRLPGPRVPDGRVAYVQWMVTDPGYRRRGYAKAVFDAILSWIAAHNVHSVELHATPDGDHLYRSYGFENAKFPLLRGVIEERQGSWAPTE